MNDMTYYWQGKRYARIDKRVARAAYDRNQTVYLQSCKYVPFSDDWPAYGLDKAHVEESSAPGRHTFDSLVNNYAFYNCNYESGYYTAYWLQE